MKHTETPSRAPMLKPPVGACVSCPLGAKPPCHFKPRKVPAGTLLWVQGDERLSLLFVKEGVLGLSATDAAGRELMAGVRGPRSMLGLEGLRSRAAHATVVALTESVVCAAEPESLREGLDVEETNTLLTFALEELEQTTRDADLRSGTALSRVARFILAYGSVIATGRQAPFSKRHVAALLGIRPETMSRCLRNLAEAKLIGAERAVRVLDAVKLGEVARGAAE